MPPLRQSRTLSCKLSRDKRDEKGSRSAVDVDQSGSIGTQATHAVSATTDLKPRGCGACAATATTADASGRPIGNIDSVNSAQISLFPQSTSFTRIAQPLDEMCVSGMLRHEEEQPTAVLVNAIE